MLLAQLGQPVVEGLGTGADGLVGTLVGAHVNRVEIGGGIGAVQADDQVIRIILLHRRIIHGL